MAAATGCRGIQPSELAAPLGRALRAAHRPAPLAERPIGAAPTGLQANRKPGPPGPNYSDRKELIHAVRSTITSRGQTVVPAPIRERFRLGPAKRLEWIVETDGSIRVVPVDADPIAAFRGSGSGGGAQRLLTERRRDREREA